MGLNDFGGADGSLRSPDPSARPAAPKPPRSAPPHRKRYIEALQCYAYGMAATCEGCGARIPTAGRGRRRAPRWCDSCQLEILHRADQADLADDPLFRSCVVCGELLGGRRADARVCSTACRVYLSRLRRARGLIERMVRYQAG